MGYDLTLRPPIGASEVGPPGLCDLLQWHLRLYMVKVIGTGAAEMIRAQSRGRADAEALCMEAPCGENNLILWGQTAFSKRRNRLNWESSQSTAKSEDFP